MRTCSLVLVLLAASFACLVPTAGAAVAARPVGMPPAGHVLLGVGGTATTPTAFDRLTGGRHELHLITVPWKEGRTWRDALHSNLDAATRGGYRLVVHVGPDDPATGREGRSPGAVSRGAADRYLLDMSRVLNESGQFIYLRPPAEMNAHWSSWAAFNANGSRRNADHSTRSYRRAFIRMALIGRGGDVAKLNAALRANGMPAVRTSLATLPSSGRVALVWNPQGRGAPDVTGNQPKDYYPGRAWVDYVANDMYVQGGKAAWPDNDALYARYRLAHPFMMLEYAPWGYDDPGFVRRVFAWSASHPRTVAVVYFNGTSAATFRLSSKPRTLAAYRSLARAPRYRCAAFSAFVETCTPPPVEAQRTLY
ncbi:MAG: celH [Thermoleophilia bacterium]|nr:celH [Thermoleophilia bacterium]